MLELTDFVDLSLNAREIKLLAKSVMGNDADSINLVNSIAKGQWSFIDLISPENFETIIEHYEYYTIDQIRFVVDSWLESEKTLKKFLATF